MGDRKGGNGGEEEGIKWTVSLNYRSGKVWEVTMEYLECGWEGRGRSGVK
jgi:hypothetical protein